MKIIYDNLSFWIGLRIYKIKIFT